MMSSPEEKTTAFAEEIAEADKEKSAAENDDALDSFLSREQIPEKPKKSGGKKTGRNIVILICAVLVVALLVGAIILLNNQPYPESDEDIYTEASYKATVDEAGIHTAIVPTDSDGEPVQNGGGTLLSYTPSDLSEVKVERTGGASFTMLSKTEDDATEYTIVGYEDIPLQTGMPDAVANDASELIFSTIASAGGNPADFGLDAPRATVEISFNDSTKAIIRLGDEAPASAGTYISFGGGDAVYLVTDDAVDSFFYDITDFVSLSVTEDAENYEDADFTAVTLSGDNYPDDIVIVPNADSSVNYSYKITSPIKMFASPSVSSEVTGSIRGLYADEVAAVVSSASELKKYGLGDGCFARIKAEYPDTVIELRCSSADSSGDVYLVNDSDGARIVYKLQIGKLGWAATTLNALIPDTVLSVNREALSDISVKTDSKTYSFTVKTITQSVETTDGDYEDVTSTEAYYKNSRLSEETFNTLFNNLSGLPRKASADGEKGTKLFEIRYTYTTGRKPDTIIVYDNGSSDLPVSLNGSIVGSTKKSYAEVLIQSVVDTAAGKTPSNI